jgi:hypothetical protein
VAAESYNVELFQGKWNGVKKNLIKEEVNTLLLATDNGGRTVFNAAANSINEEKFQGILNSAKENLTNRR